MQQKIALAKEAAAREAAYRYTLIISLINYRECLKHFLKQKYYCIFFCFYFLSGGENIFYFRAGSVSFQFANIYLKLLSRCCHCRSAEISSHASADARTSAKHLVAIQQRLATLKDAVAAAQRVAAAREAAAAAAIQRVAANTAAELKKQDVDKQISQSEQEAKVTVSAGHKSTKLRGNRANFQRIFLFPV